MRCFGWIIIFFSLGWQKETFEEMLNRQKAELNALMEAHRKQQLEFMGNYKIDSQVGDFC